ncbi:hypothetical protein [Nocardia sp. NPDC059239]|uniref:hypothetical protein n=1 Tax=Nocardia sp. NPDC059239 TaxID=3346785 RepID=UPI0036B628DC
MSYAIDQLPDLAPLGGHWATATSRDAAFGHAVEIGQALLPSVEWPYQPSQCPAHRGTWYLDGELLLCDGCSIDIT